MLWSFVMRPTRLPFLVRCCASLRMAVVFPAPRKPPIMMYFARLMDASFCCSVAPARVRHRGRAGLKVFTSPCSVLTLLDCDGCNTVAHARCGQTNTAALGKHQSAALQVNHLTRPPRRHAWRQPIQHRLAVALGLDNP